jgi:hypothetical protein
VHPNLRKLSTVQLVSVLTAAGQLRWRARERFVVAQQLDGHEVGDYRGSTYRDGSIPFRANRQTLKIARQSVLSRRC